MLTLRALIKVEGPYSGKTKFDFFKNLQVGDEVMVSMELTKVERGPSSGLYATGVTLTNLSRGGTFIDSQTNVANYLSKIPHSPRDGVMSKYLS